MHGYTSPGRNVKYFVNDKFKNSLSTVSELKSHPILMCAQNVRTLLIRISFLIEELTSRKNL